MSNELIQDKNYHTNLTKQRYQQTEQSQPMQIPETDTEPKQKEVENQTKKLEREENITYITENLKNNRKDSTEKYRKNVRMSRIIMLRKNSRKLKVKIA